MDNTVDTSMLDAMQIGTPAQQSDAAPTLADVISGGEKAEDVQQPNGDEQRTEPGYVRGRVEKALAKQAAEYDEKFAQMQQTIDRLTQTNLEREAKDRVAAGDFKTEELALKYLRMERNLPVQVDPPKTEDTRARDEKGRFVEADADVQKRANDLYQQAQMLKRSIGVDPMEIYNTNPDVRQKVLSGEWDFADVIANMGGYRAASRPPTVVRTPSNGGVGAVSFRSMSDEQFDKVNEYLAKGKRIDMRR